MKYKELTESKKLIEWFWSEYHSDNIKQYQWDNDGFCQCSSENIINNSHDPELMRPFLLIGMLIDQMMYTHFQTYYNKFIQEFKYPKLYNHIGSGMASPSWFVYSHHGYDKKMDWSKAIDIAQVLLGALFCWFSQVSVSEKEIERFKSILCREITFEFEQHNTERLLHMIASIKCCDSIRKL